MKPATQLVLSTSDIECQLSSLVTPSGRLDVDSSKFTLAKIPRFVSRRTPKDTRRWQSEQWRRSQPRLLTSPGPAHTTSNFALNEYRGVVNSSGLAVYKGSTQEIIVATESKE